MCRTDINIINFKEKFPEIKRSLEDARFISFDLEFSALYPLKEYSPSIFDTPSERYRKLRKIMEHVVPIQIGITAFTCDLTDNCFRGKIYNFYLLPPSFPTIHKNFLFDPGAVKFLAFHGFDFNQFASVGLPFLSSPEEETLRKKLKQGTITNDVAESKLELNSLFFEVRKKVREWYKVAKHGDKLSLPEIYDKFWNSYEMLYFIHKRFRCKFSKVWTFVDEKNKDFVLQKLTVEECAKLEASQNLEEELISQLLGFTRVFRLLASLKKPIVGHNCFQDLFLMVHSFDSPLPSSYSCFKKRMNQLFPVIFDTKHISRAIKLEVPLRKRWHDKGLDFLYRFFSQDVGRFLVYDVPKLEHANNGYVEKYHEAGWDSYCTGYIFLCMAFWALNRNYSGLRPFVSPHLIQALEEFKNKINVIRCSVHCVKLDGDDPKPIKPPFLVLQSNIKRNLSIYQVSNMLSGLGFFEIRTFPFHRGRYLIATDNDQTARKIHEEFLGDEEFTITEYSWWEHSAGANVCKFTGVVATSFLLVLVADTLITKYR
nr:pre-piRNA 3'-exonuclease trimmer-like [Leptinotarsa decemlineata]